VEGSGPLDSLVVEQSEEERPSTGESETSESQGRAGYLYQTVETQSTPSELPSLRDSHAAS
jgi:hypothetical protein